MTFHLKAVVAKRRRRQSPIARRALLAALASMGICAVAQADTTGNGPGIPIPATTVSTDAAWGFIRNEYLLVSVGFTGSYSVPNITSNIPGRISIGTTGGSPRTAADNGIPLMGRQATVGTLAVWPYAASYADFGDFPSYVRVLLDGTNQVNLGFDTGQVNSSPYFYSLDDGYALQSLYTVGTNVQIRQTIRLRRGLARLEWRITNNDNVAHTVGLRYTSCVRGNEYFYQDPLRGTSDRIQTFDGNTLPDSLYVYNRRADSGADLTPPFSIRQVFRGISDVTTPSQVVVADAANMIPLAGTGLFGPYEVTAYNQLLPNFEFGLGTAVYFGGPRGYSLQPGQTQTVVTYYGLGTSTDLVDPDFVTGTEAPESLQYRTAAALDPEVVGNTSATLQSVGYRFLTTNDDTPRDAENPSRFRIYASVYNQKLNNQLFDVRLNDVTMSLTLPKGLRLARVPGSDQRDVPTKSAVPVGAGESGEVRGDQEGIVSWYVEPTGEAFGPLTYQVSVSVGQPNPLSRNITRVINVPAIPLKELVTGAFNMVGFPFSFDPLLSNNGDPDTILNSLTRPEEDVTVFEYTGNINQPYRPATKLEEGVGYFFKPAIPNSGSATSRLIFLRGAKPVIRQAPTGSTEPRPVQLQLKPGWNLISNPYVYEIPLNYLRLAPVGQDVNPALDTVTFADALNGGLIRGGIFYYSPTERSYRFFEDLSATIKPWQAYWIYANASLVLRYSTPTQRQSLILPSNGTEPATRKIVTTENWRLPLLARRQDGAQDLTTTIGMIAASAKKESRDDILKPPAIQDYVTVGLVKNGQTSRFARLLQSGSGKKTWDLTVESDGDGTTTLTWPEISQLPKRVRLQLTDLQSGRTIDMRSISSTQVAVRKNGVSRLRIVAQTGSSQPLVITNMRTVPTRGTGGGYTFAYSITRSATVSARITTLTGSVVRVLSTSRAADSGENRIHWDGRSAQGAALPIGSYRLEMTAVSDDGDAITKPAIFQTVR
jgi:hypothetical protein